jgi:hypothetical protein
MYLVYYFIHHMFKTIGTKKYDNDYRVKSVKNEKKVMGNDKVFIEELKIEFKQLKKYVNENNKFLEQEIKYVKYANMEKLAEFEQKIDECGLG